MIEVRGLSKKYGSVAAVHDLSFSVDSGRVTGFLGPNGAGKSTTMRMMLALDRPNAGTCTFDGTPYRELRRPARVVGVSLDSTQFHKGRSARNHLRWLAAVSDIDPKRIDIVLDLVGLTDAADRRVGGFSLGMKQRLGLATALLGDPQVVICDEPANGLDPAGISWLREMFRHLASEGRTVFVSSHQLAEMAQTADDLVVIRKGGHLVSHTTLAEFVSAGTRETVRVRSPQATLLAQEVTRQGAVVGNVGDDAFTATGMSSDQIGEIAAQHACVLYLLAPESSSLERVFLEATGEADAVAAESERAKGLLR
ncbi:MAG: ATP-binding cassette domain-containing protein [Acidimicrobiia bacterium]